MERTVRQQIESAPERGGTVVVGALHGDFRVVEAMGIQRHGGAGWTAAEELDEAAWPDGGEGVLPGGGRAGGFDGDVEAVPGPGELREPRRLAAVAVHLHDGVRA